MDSAQLVVQGILKPCRRWLAPGSVVLDRAACPRCKCTMSLRHVCEWCFQHQWLNKTRQEQVAHCTNCRVHSTDESIHVLDSRPWKRSRMDYPQLCHSTSPRFE
jgi:hypothetical protein